METGKTDPGSIWNGYVSKTQPFSLPHQVGYDARRPQPSIDKVKPAWQNWDLTSGLLFI